MSEPSVYLVDAHNYIFRAYHGLPPMHNPEGLATHATFGFARTLLRVLREHQPPYAAVLFEGRRTFRTAIYPQYKANRVEPPDDLRPQFEYSRRIAAALGFSCRELDGFEADDLIGTAARKLSERGLRVVMVSGDKDLAQLVSDEVVLLDIAKNRELDTTGVEATFGVQPAQIPDLLALTGDSIDNIPGVPGVGPKTAVALLKAAGSVDALIHHPDLIDSLDIRGRKSLKAKLAAAVEQLSLSRHLATIRRDAPLDVEPDDLRYDGALRSEIDPLFEELGFGDRIRMEIPRWDEGGQPPSGTRGPPTPAPAETGRLDL